MTHQTENHCSSNNVEAVTTAHDWEAEKRAYNDFYDDGTMSFFWRAHTLLVLLIFTCCLVYISLFEDPETISVEYNMKRGIIAMILVFLLVGVTQTPDGPFRRPHPAFWRLVLCISIVYELSLIFILFQTVDTSRQVLKHIDKSLGEQLPEREYCQNCYLYDSAKPDSPFHNIWDKMDLFVPTHFFGWWMKTLVLRDYWLCTVLSIMFEVLEYTLEHQLPNFCECWWDHWILDALVCNGLGIYLGMKTLKYLKLKRYHWRGMWNIPTFSGRLGRIVSQFTPYFWMEFSWQPTATLKRWISMIGVITMFLLAELNSFYLKFVLWLPSDHFIGVIRLVMFLFWGAVGMRETFQFLDDPNCKKFGRQSWLVVAIIITELLIVIKFDHLTITKPLPLLVKYFWILGIMGLTVWTIWHFYIIPYTSKKEGLAMQSRDDDVTNQRKDRNFNDFAQGSGNRNAMKNGSKSVRQRGKNSRNN